MLSIPYLKCSIPSCDKTAGQHCKIKNNNKQVCSAHRTTKKYIVDNWKMEQGCANKDGHYGFECVCYTIIAPETLDINHIDGNNNNRDPSNIEVLCKMCHTVVTMKFNHHKTTKTPRESVNADTGLFDWDNITLQNSVEPAPVLAK
jgi:hypothetical protein